MFPPFVILSEVKDPVKESEEILKVTTPVD